MDPVPTSTAKGRQEPEMDLLSAILSNFNDMFGNINWNDADNVRRQILEIPGMVSRDEQYQNAMRNSDKQEARTESDRVLQKVIFLHHGRQHGALQAVHGQSRIQEVAERSGVQFDL